MDFKKRINKAFDDVDKILQDGTSLPAKIRVSLRHALENLATACTSYDDYDRGYLSNSRKPIKSGYYSGNYDEDFDPADQGYTSYEGPGTVCRCPFPNGTMEEQEFRDGWEMAARDNHDTDDLKNRRIANSRKPIKSDFDDNGNWVDDEKPIKKEDMHGSFRKLSQEEHDKLKPQVEEELDKWMSKKHFGLDKEVYDETVEYIISLFGEDNYAPRDVKEAVSSWYNDTLDSFPEMLQGKGDKRKIASAAYLKQLKSSHCIKSSRKPIKSSTYQFVAEFDGQYQPRVIDYMFKNGSPSWIDLNEDWSNGKMFTEQELPKVAKQLERYYAENGQGGASDIEIVKDNGESVYLEEFLQEGSFDKAWKQIEDNWLDDTMTK